MKNFALNLYGTGKPDQVIRELIRKSALTLPAVTASDNGKFLTVVNGAWAATTIPEAHGEEF